MPRPIPALFAALTLLGCRTDKESTLNTIEGGGGDGTPTWELVLTLESAATPAGEGVGYGLVMVSSGGETADVTGQVSSDLEPTLFVDAEELVPTVAGSHTLTGAATYDGTPFTTTATLTVDPGAVARIDLALSDISFPAGDSVSYTLSAWDAWGNDAGTSGIDVSADSGSVSIGGGTISSTTPGTYVARAEEGDVFDSETFVVSTGIARSVELTLSDTDLEIFETTHATVRVLDEYGNETADPWTITAYGTGMTAVSFANVTFYEEGEYYVRVDVDGTSLYDEVGPLVIDSKGPELVVDNPERGDWIYGSTGTVSGSVSDEWSGVVDLTVNGETATVASDGSFSHGVTYDFGMNVVETTATDGDGNESTDTRAVLAGDFEPYGNGVANGLLARLHEGSGGIDELEQMGEDLISATDLDDLIPYPVYSAEEEDCYTVLWWEVCVTWYALDLYVTSPRIGSTDLEIDPTSAGVLDSRFTVYDVSLNWSADATVVFIDYSGSGSITVDSLTIDMDLYPYVSAGNIGVNVNSVSVGSSGFDFDWDSWLWDVIDFFGIPLDEYIAGYVEDALEGAVSDEVPAMLEDALQDLEIGYSFDVGGSTYDFDAVPYAISVDDKGITLSLETFFTASAWTLPRTGEGSLYYGYSTPSWTGSPGTILGVSGDFLNQVFLAFWGGGLLSMEMTGDDLGVSAEDLAVIFPDLTELTVAVDPLLPPVAVPGTGTSLLDLQVGDMELTLYNGPAEPGYEMLQVYVSAVAGLDLAATSDNTLSASLGDMDLWFDVVYPESNTMGAADTEALLEALVPLLLPMLTEALGEVPIPDISGFTISGISVGLGGAEDGFVTLGGNLTQL